MAYEAGVEEDDYIVSIHGELTAGLTEADIMQLCKKSVNMLMIEITKVIFARTDSFYSILTLH